MNIEDFVVIRCEQGDIICMDFADAELTIACCEIKHARIEKYNFEEHCSCILKVIGKISYAPV